MTNGATVTTDDAERASVAEPSHRQTSLAEPTGNDPLAGLSGPGLWLTAILSLAVGVAITHVPSWALDEPVRTIVAFASTTVGWTVIVIGAVLILRAVGITTLVPVRGPKPLKGVILAVAGGVLGLGFVIGMASRNWAVYTSGGAPADFLSVVVDAALTLLLVVAGFTLALATLTLLLGDDRSHDPSGDAHESGSARPQREGAR